MGEEERDSFEELKKDGFDFFFFELGFLIFCPEWGVLWIFGFGLFRFF